MRALIISSFVFLYYPLSAVAAISSDNKTMDNTVSYGHILNWSLGLLVVLCLFFACVWFMRKMGVLSISPKQSMRVVTGLSLGVREKLVLVQVGDRQLVLGVTPGRIDNLLVLEGDDQLFLDKSGSEEKNEFSLKLKQVMAGTGNE